MKTFHEREIKLVYKIPYNTFYDNYWRYKKWRKRQAPSGYAPPQSSLAGGIDAERAEVARIMGEDVREGDFQTGTSLLKSDVLEYISETGTHPEHLLDIAKVMGTKDIALHDFELWLLERKAREFLLFIRQHGYHQLPLMKCGIIIGYTESSIHKELANFVGRLNQQIFKRRGDHPDGILRDESGVALPGQPRALSGQGPQGHFFVGDGEWCTGGPLVGGSCLEREIGNIENKKYKSNTTNMPQSLTPEQVMRTERANARRSIDQLLMDEKWAEYEMTGGGWRP